MKQLFSAILLSASTLVFGQHFAANERVGSLPSEGATLQETTRAVVIGISQYQDDGLPDLQFAHRDAQVFEEYLRSNAGGAIPPTHIRLLTNEQATLAAIDDALDWLAQETKQGDKAILYFSGHGDVEKQTLWQRGYLLAHDTPASNFRNNAVRVEDLDDLVKTLSVGHDSKVIIFLDACRSGKLANAGASLTNDQLAKQVENEVRILSCKSDQKSLEGVQWGQGRGLFSYYLVHGLKGLADAQDDQVVTFDELKRYLEDNVKKALSAPEIVARQNPVFVGDEAFELAAVDEQALAALNVELETVATEGTSLSAIASRDAAAPEADFFSPEPTAKKEEEALADFLKKADFAGLVLRPEFEQASAGRQELLRYFIDHLAVPELSADSSFSHAAAVDSFRALVRKAAENEKSGDELAQRIAVELHDRAQFGINSYLRSDANELAMRQLREGAMRFSQYPKMLHAALILLKPGHPLYARTEVKFLYFDGVNARLEFDMGLPGITNKIPLEKQLKALAKDDKAPYIHNELGLLYLRTWELTLAKKHLELAVDLAPGWAIPWSNLSILFRLEKQLEKAKAYARKAIELQPTFSKAYVNLGNCWQDEQNFLQAETLYRQAVLCRDNEYLPYENLAYLLSATTEYEAADWLFSEAENLKSGFILSRSIHVKDPHFEIFAGADANIPALKPLEKMPVPKTEAEFLALGKHYFNHQDYSLAEPNFRKVLDFNPDNREVYYYLGLSLYHLGRFEEAELSLDKLLKQRPDEPMLWFHLADVYEKQGRHLEEEKLYRWMLGLHSAPSSEANESYLRLISLLRKQHRYPEQEKLLVEYAALFDNLDQHRLADFYEEMATSFPTNPEWLYRKGALLYEQDKPWLATPVFEKLLEMDTTYPAIGHVHQQIGTFYQTVSASATRTIEQSILGESTLSDKSDGSTNEALAIEHFLAAMRLEPAQSTSKFGLVAVYLQLRRYHDALPLLEDLLQKNQIDLPRRLQLADLYCRSGKFAKADTLLHTANRIRFEEVKGLLALQGKHAMLQKKHKAAIGFYEASLTQTAHKNHSETCYTLARLHARLGHQNEAMDWLNRALEIGFRYERVLKYDVDWNALRQQPAFGELLQRYDLKS